MACSVTLLFQIRIFSEGKGHSSFKILNFSGLNWCGVCDFAVVPGFEFSGYSSIFLLNILKFVLYFLKHEH